MSSAANEATQQIIAAFGRRRPGWRVDLQQSPPRRKPAAGAISGWPPTNARATRSASAASPASPTPSWPPVHDTNPVVQDFVRCCLDHKPAG
jgi:hypothetical protein